MKYSNKYGIWIYGYIIVSELCVQDCVHGEQDRKLQAPGEKYTM